MNKIVVLIHALLAGSLLAGPAAFVSINQLTQKADAIVVGTVRNSTLSGAVASVQLHIDRTLKGSQAEGQEITVSWQAGENASRQPGAPTNGTGIWFLQSAAGGWIVLPTMVGDVPLLRAYLTLPAVSLGADFAYSPSAPAEEKVLSEIVSALDAAKGKTALTQLVTAGAIDFSEYPQLESAFARFSDPTLRALGVNVLLRSGKTDVLNTVSADAALKSQVAVITAICDLRASDPESIRTLGSMISDASPNLAACAAHSLRSIHTKETLPFLAQLLDSPSIEQQYEGVAGLASFANNLPVQTRENVANLGSIQAQSGGVYMTPDIQKNFPTKPEFEIGRLRYVDFWKSWWSANQQTLR